ncbi:MAG: WG repeat-containing protein [Saprospiraceae bacterium]
MLIIRTLFLFLTLIVVLQCKSDAQESTSKSPRHMLPQRAVGGLYGYIDIEGRWLIDARYDTVTVFEERGFAFVKNANGWSCIDSVGDVLVSNVVQRLDFGGSSNWLDTKDLLASELVWVQLVEDSIALLHTRIGMLGKYGVAPNYNKHSEITSALGRRVISVSGSNEGWRSVSVNGHTVLFDSNWKKYGDWTGGRVATTAGRFYVNDSDSTTIVYEYDHPDSPLHFPYIVQPYSPDYPGLEVHSRVSIKRDEWPARERHISPFLYLQLDDRVMSSVLVNPEGDTLLSQDFPARSGIYPCGKDIDDAPRGAFACTSAPVEILDQYSMDRHDLLKLIQQSQTRALVDETIPNPPGKSRLVASTDSTWWVLTTDSLKLVRQKTKEVIASGPTVQFGEVALEEYYFTQLDKDRSNSPYSNVFATPEGVYETSGSGFKNVFEINSSLGERTKRSEHHLYAIIQLLTAGIEPSKTLLLDPESGWLLGNVSMVSEDLYIGMCANRKWGVFNKNGSIVKPPVYDVLIQHGRQINQFTQEDGFSLVMTLSEDIVITEKKRAEQTRSKATKKELKPAETTRDERHVRRQTELTHQVSNRFPEARVEDWVPRVVPSPTIKKTKAITGMFELPSEWRFVQPKVGGGRLVRANSDR